MYIVACRLMQVCWSYWTQRLSYAYISLCYTLLAFMAHQGFLLCCSVHALCELSCYTSWAL